MSKSKEFKLGEDSSMVSFDQVLDGVKNQVRQVPRSQVIKDMFAFFKQQPLSDEQAKEFYEVARSKVKSSSCTRCGRLKCHDFEGVPVFFMGDKRFVCFACQEILREKGQID